MISLKNVHVVYPVFTTEQSQSFQALIEKGLLRRTALNNNSIIIVNALKDITTKIEDGDRLGLVGKNGAGKTTFLKAIAGIYPVAKGEITVEGEVRGFFNIDAGLDLYASGFKNVFNLSFFYTRDIKEIKRKMDWIVDFSELKEFMYLPVSTYSAGMQARLLVSVALAYPTENILFDEAIGAGDEKFMNKVKEYLDEMVAKSRCFILASHSPELIKKYCNKGVFLDDGKIVREGTVEEVIDSYQESG